MFLYKTHLGFGFTLHEFVIGIVTTHTWSLILICFYRCHKSNWVGVRMKISKWVHPTLTLPQENKNQYEGDVDNNTPPMAVSVFHRNQHPTPNTVRWRSYGSLHSWPLYWRLPLWPPMASLLRITLVLRQGNKNHNKATCNGCINTNGLGK